MTKLGMQVQERTFLKRIDWNLALYIVALNFVGLINLYSATHGPQSTTLNLFMIQSVWLLFGWIVFFIVTLFDYDYLKRISYFIYMLNIVALTLVPFIGKSFYGAKRWLSLGFANYQPAETMKIALILVLARALAGKSKPDGLGIRDLIFPLTLTLVPFALIAKQPDLGTAIMVFAIFASMVIFVGIKRSVVISAVVIGIGVFYVGWNFGLKEYQKNRIETFLNPGKDPRGTGYNSIQSKIAVGSGKIVGRGFRKGTQSQLEFLPERHTDFIFSVLSEEFGFVGSLTTVVFFVFLLLAMIRIAQQARDKFGVLLVVGVLSYLFFHAFVNIGMVLGLLPIVGVPLPLLSYGGSSLLATMVCLGLASSVAYRKFLF